MKHVSVVILFLLIAVWAVAQGTQSQSASSSNTASGQAVTPSTIIITGQNGLSTNTGTAVILAPPSAPMVVTPEFHLAPMLTSVGATNATPGNYAGAVNATAAIPLQPRMVTTVPQFSTAGAAVTETVPPQEATGALLTGAEGAAGGTPVVIVNNNNRAPLNIGLGAPNLMFNSGANSGKSLAQIAREYRQREAGANATRVYTNQDIERINQQPQTQIGGTSGAAVGVGAHARPQQSGNTPAVSQPSAAPEANPGVSQPVPPASTTPPANTPPQQQGQVVAPSSKTSGDATETGEISETPFRGRSAAQQPQPAPTQQDLQSATHPPTLPGGGSVLPIMAVVGFLATTAGLLAK